MNQITDDPNVYGFGTTFNYQQWTMETIVTLTNVPWNNDYRDVVLFDSVVALNAYIDGSASDNEVITQASYAPATWPIRLDMPFNRVGRYNYLRAHNPAQPTGRGDYVQDLYYFITDVTYIAPDTTEITLQLDVWSTYGRRVRFGRCYIERGHIGIANTRQMNNAGRDYLTIPEGLDTGSDYVTKAIRAYEIEDKVIGDTLVVASPILVCSTVDLDADPGNVDNPKLIAAGGGYLSGMVSGASYYLFPNSLLFATWMQEYQDKPWVTQGIISITHVPGIEKFFDADQVDIDWDGVIGPDTPLKRAVPAKRPKAVQHDMKIDWRNTLTELIEPRYQRLKKFLTSPYLMIEMTSWSGTPVFLKPELWNSANARITLMANYVPPNQRIAAFPRWYNAATGIDTGFLGGRDDGGDGLDNATIISSFPSTAIVNNMAISYMASNANMMSFQQSNSDWSQQKALRGNETSYDQASKGITTSGEMADTARRADSNQTALGNQTLQSQQQLNAISGIATGAASGAVGGPAGMAIGTGMAIAGAVTSGMSNAIQMSHNSESLAIRTEAGRQNNMNQNSNSRYVRDTNRSLADWAAKGDYEQDIASQNAKVQDTKLTQPGVSGQVGGDAFNSVNDIVHISVRWKGLDGASMRRIGEYWLRYGYAVAQFAIPPQSLHVMSKFTYWKMRETYLRTAPMPESFKQAIRGIFEKGVTVWNDPDDIGMIDPADNIPLGGVTL